MPITGGVNSSGIARVLICYSTEGRWVEQIEPAEGGLPSRNRPPAIIWLDGCRIDASGAKFHAPVRLCTRSRLQAATEQRP